MGQIEYEPARRDLLHPRTHKRDTLAAEKKPVVPVRQGPKDHHSAYPAFVSIYLCLHASPINNFSAICYYKLRDHCGEEIGIEGQRPWWGDHCIAEGIKTPFRIR